MASVLLSLSILGFVVDPAPHDLPDGCVKVATQVIVQADSTSIRYDIGFNPETLEQLLKSYKVEVKADATRAEKTDAFRKAFKAKIKDSLQLKVGDHLTEIQEIGVDANEVSKHVQARFNLKYEVLVKEETKIEIHDNSFKGMSRIWNAGFKAALPVAVKESSVQAIPLRSKPEEKPAEETEPFIISGTVVKLSIGVETKSKTSMAPLFVLAFSLGGAGMVGLLLVPNDGGDDHHDHH